MLYANYKQLQVSLVTKPPELLILADQNIPQNHIKTLPSIIIIIIHHTNAFHLFTAPLHLNNEHDMCITSFWEPLSGSLSRAYSGMTSGAQRSFFYVQGNISQKTVIQWSGHETNLQLVRILPSAV